MNGPEEEKIKGAAAEAVKVIATAAGEATKVVANAAAESAKILSQMSAKNSNDHDLIIQLDTKMDGLKDDIKMLNDGTNNKISDHEARIRKNEAIISRIIGALILTQIIIVPIIIYLFIRTLK